VSLGIVVTRRVSTAEAKAKLSELIGSVAYGKERVLIERHGRPVAALVSVDDAQSLEEADVQVNRRRGALALIGRSADIDDQLIDQLVDDVYSSRARDQGRSVELES
jgi:prevent-host-death family protein